MKKLSFLIFGIFLSFTIAFFGVKQVTSSFCLGGTNASELELSEGKFLVRFYDENLHGEEGQVLLYQKEFNVGEEVEYDGPEPYKEMTKEQRFVFECWEDDAGAEVTLSEITESKDVYARYSAENNEYNIFYYLNGGSEEEEKTNPTSYDMTSGQITLNEPKKMGDEFVGWLGTDLTQVTKTVTFEATDLKNREYFAIYKNSEVAVNFVNDSLADYGTYYADTEDKGNSVEVSFSEDFNFNREEGTVTVGEKTYTATPLTESNAYSYDFVGLKYSFNDDEVPTIVVTASYSRTVKTYTITYNGVEGSNFSGVKQYSIESSTIHLIRPVKSGFTFTGWTGTDIEGDAPVLDVTITITEENLKTREYTAHFDAETYTLTIVVSTSSTGYGTVDVESISNLAYGTKVTYSSNKLYVGEGDERQTVTATPSEQTNQYTYKFNFWSSVPNEIKKSTTVYANFYRESRTYNLYFDDTLTVKTPDGEDVHYGDSFAYDTELAVYFTESPNKHKTSLSCNGEEIDVTETDGGGYGNFKVTQTTYLHYSEDWDRFTVYFEVNKDNAGHVDRAQVDDVVYGTEVVVQGNKLILRYLTSSTEITATANEPNEQYNFVFSKWETNGVTTVTEEVTFVAIFQDLLTEKRLEFPDNVIVTSGEGDELVTYSSGDIVPFGTTITISYVETEHHHKTVFTVNGEDGTNGMTFEVTEDVEILYDEEIDTFTVTYSDGVILRRVSGRIIPNGSEVAYGSMLFADYELDPHTKCETFTLNGEEIEKGHEFMVEGEVEIVFVKVKDKIEIKLGETENGTFTLSANSIEFGEEVEVFATPNEFFKVQEVYYITDNGEVTQIYDFKFVMPNEEITVYVKFEKDYFVLADNLRGVFVAVKVDDVAQEPTISVAEVTGDIANYASGLYNSTNIKIFEIKILVNDEEVTNLDHPIIITFKLAEGQSAEKLQCFLISGESGVFTNQALALSIDESKSEARVTTSALGTFAFGEKQAQSSGTPNPSDSQQPKKTNTVLIVCLVTGAVLVVTTVIIVVVLVKRNKNKKKKV